MVTNYAIYPSTVRDENPDKAPSQDTIDRVAAALEGADIGHSMSLTRLVDGIHTYTLKIRGEIETFVDSDEASAIEQVYARIREVKHRLQAEAVIAALHSALSTSQSDPAPAPEIAARRVKLTKEGAKDAALDLVRKNGWKPGSAVSLHSTVQLMAAFGLMVDAGEVQCDWPNCGCCADAACRDAVTFMDSEAEIAALKDDANLYRQRYRALCDWYFRGGKRSEIFEHGHIIQTTQQHIDDWADHAAVAPEPHGVGQ